MAVYYDEKRKSYYCKFRYTDWTGKSRHTTKRGFKTKREARNYEQDFKRSSSSTPDITISMLIEEKRAHDAKRLKESTCLRRKAAYEKYIEPKLGTLMASKITPNVIRKWQNSLPADFSNSTIAFLNATFCALLNFGVRFYGLPNNPFDIAGKTGRYEKRKTILEPEQFSKLIEQPMKPVYHLLFRLLFYSGLRIGEALALTIHDLDFTNNTVSVTKSISPTGVVTPPKTTNSIRTITIPADIMQEILDYRSKFVQPPDEIFRVRTNLVNAALHRWLEKAGLPSISPHGLRHSHASLLIQQGVPITSIASRLGHSPKETLETYAHVYQKNDNEIAEILTKIIQN